MVTGLVATLSWNMVPRNNQIPNTDKVVMENYIPVLNLFFAKKGGFEFYRLLEFPLSIFVY